MRTVLLMILPLLMLSACSTMQPPRYSISVDNIQQLKAYQGAKAEVVSLAQPADFNPNCRLMGPIEPADGMTFPEFICKAFNDEFKMAGIYSQEGVKLSGDITKLAFSSSVGLVSGYWDISLRLTSSNGHSLTVSNKYTFKTGVDAITACNATADAFTPAVQDLIQATINHPDFSKLLMYDPEEPGFAPEKGKSVSPASEDDEIDRDGRFIAYGDGTVLDAKTSLMWASADSGKDLTHNQAKAYCEGYRGGGHNDWRMPKLAEIQSLYDEGTRNSYGYHITRLIHIDNDWIWCNQDQWGGVAAFNFSTGSAAIGKTLSSEIYFLRNQGARCLPVRTAQNQSR